MHGTLVDAAGSPLAGIELTGYAVVRAEGRYAVVNFRAETEASGRFTLANAPSLPSAELPVMLMAIRPNARYGPVRLDSEGGRAVLATTQTASLTVTALDPGGKPAAGVSVSCQVQGVPEARTDAGGRFHLTGVPRGKHFLVASRSNAYGSGAESATGQTDVVIRLQPESKPIPGLVSGDKTGSVAPEIKAASWTNNGPVDLKALRGKIVVIDLCVWCGPCVASLPEVLRLSSKYGPRGVTVIGIHAPGTPKEKVASFVKQRGLTYPVAIDVAEDSGVGVTAKAFGLAGIPHLLVIDANGKVVADTSEVDDAEKSLRKLLGD